MTRSRSAPPATPFPASLSTRQLQAAIPRLGLRMMMFSGAVAGLRNPRAHKLIKDDPERAFEFIAYVRLLAKLVDEAKKA